MFYKHIIYKIAIPKGLRFKEKINKIEKMQTLKTEVKHLASAVQESSSVLLTTHRTCDGDGLGALTGLYYGLQQMGKTVRILTVDSIPQKYRFFMPDKNVETFNHLKTPVEEKELALICDTNDHRLIEPLYGELLKKQKKIIFIDHHKPLNSEDLCPQALYLINENSASTGELVYFILNEMGLKINEPIAKALYASILSDTAQFQFIKNSSVSFNICAQLLPLIKEGSLVQQKLFSMSKKKLKLLSKSLNQMQYFYEDQVALLEIEEKEMHENNLRTADACDFIEMALKVPEVKVSVLIVQLMKKNSKDGRAYKLSFRGKNTDVCGLAEAFDGGGHKHSSGALLNDYQKNIKQEILEKAKKLIA